MTQFPNTPGDVADQMEPRQLIDYRSGAVVLDTVGLGAEPFSDVDDEPSVEFLVYEYSDGSKLYSAPNVAVDGLLALILADGRVLRDVYGDEFRNWQSSNVKDESGASIVDQLRDADAGCGMALTKHDEAEIQRLFGGKP